MSQLNPLAGAILQSLQTQREAGVEKERQIRRAQVLEKDAAAQTDRFEHQVESSDELSSIGEEGKGRDPAKREQKPRDGAGEEDDDEGDQTDAHVDLTA